MAKSVVKCIYVVKYAYKLLKILRLYFNLNLFQDKLPDALDDSYLKGTCFNPIKQ